MIEFIKRMLCSHNFVFLQRVNQLSYENNPAGANDYYLCKKCGKIRKIKLR